MCYIKKCADTLDVSYLARTMYTPSNKVRIKKKQWSPKEGLSAEQSKYSKKDESKMICGNNTMKEREKKCIVLRILWKMLSFFLTVCSHTSEIVLIQIPRKINWNFGLSLIWCIFYAVENNKNGMIVLY